MNESHALRRLLRFLWQFRLWLWISLLCAFISVLFSVIAPLLIGRIIDGITSGTAAGISSPGLSMTSISSATAFCRGFPPCSAVRPPSC